MCAYAQIGKFKMQLISMYCASLLLLYLNALLIQISGPTNLQPVSSRIFQCILVVEYQLEEANQTKSQYHNNDNDGSGLSQAQRIVHAIVHKPLFSIEVKVRSMEEKQ